ncbi:MAG: hypothetical protein IPK19_23445 [Chloroflexi bacterium]|nr:hypothetical protein [Chloroflexota bacterium]
MRERDRALAERECAASDIERLALDFKVSQFEAALQWIDRCAYFGEHT